MTQTLIHATENLNIYIYDIRHKLSMLVHPELRKVFEYSPDIDPYYLAKYEYLRRHSFFIKNYLPDFTSSYESPGKNIIAQTQQIIFETTDKCNLKCNYCESGELYENLEKKSNKNLNFCTATTLLKHIFDLKIKIKSDQLAISFYGGEPLLNFKFITQIVEVANHLSVESKMKISYNATTNATLIHKYIDFLVANQFYLLISLDGNEENHSYRVFSKDKSNSFWKVIENTDMIQRNYPEYFASHVSFNAVLHNRNSVKEIYEFIYSRYQKIPRISELTRDFVRPDKKDIHKRMVHSLRKSEAEYQSEASEMLQKTHTESVVFKELREFLRFFSINAFVSDKTSLFQNAKKFSPTSTCIPFSAKTFLTASNKLLPCEKISHKYSMGKVSKNVIIDVERITQQFSFYYEHIKKICQDCYLFRFCGVCLLTIDKLDKLGTDEFVCESFHDQHAFEKKLNRIFTFLEK